MSPVPMIMSDWPENIACSRMLTELHVSLFMLYSLWVKGIFLVQDI